MFKKRSSGASSRKTRRKLSKLTIGLFAAAAVMLGLAAVGTTQAVLQYQSKYYVAQVDVKSIGVSLNENGQKVSYRDYTHKDNAWNSSNGELLANMLTESGDNQLILNKYYTEKLNVTNSGTIDEYVRVIVRRYWTDKDGNKLTDIDPSLIDLNLTQGSGWVKNDAESTDEREVLYYTQSVASGATTADFADKIRVKEGVAFSVTQSESNGVITTKYSYDGKQFVLEVEVDAVQTHNAADAIRSAWGVDPASLGISLAD